MNSENNKPKFFIVTTVAESLSFFKGQLKYLSKRFDICAISSDKRKLKKIGESESIRIKFIQMKRSISILEDFYSLFKFIVLFIKEKPKIVHGNTPKASLLSIVAAWITRRPIRIYMCHGLRYQGVYGVFRRLLMLMEQITCKCATNVICVSQGVRNTLEKDKICGHEKMSVVRFGSAGGIDLNYYSRKMVTRNIRSELNIKESDFIFTFVGRLVGDKGVNELAFAFNELSKRRDDIYLFLVGPEEKDQNPISMETESIISSNNRIYSFGRVNDVRPYIVSSNAFVLPSYREGFGMVLIEAAALDVPSITTNIIGCNEVIIDGVNGSVIPPKDQDALIQIMTEWLANPNLIKRYASVARRIAIERFDQRDVWNAYKEYYLSLINNV